MINHAMQHRLARALILASPLLCFGSEVCTCQTGIKHLRTGAKMIDRIVAREMREHLTGSCIVACHGSTASPEKTKLRSSAWEVVVPRYASSKNWSVGQRNAQEKPGTTLQKLLLELSQVAGNLKL